MARVRSAGLARCLFVALALVGSGAVVTATTEDAAAQPRVSRPWMGVAMDNVAQGAGAKVKHVVRTSPADKAGIREADRIVRVDGTAVGSSNEVIRIVSGHAVGEQVAMTLFRAGRELNVRVDLAAFPTYDAMMRMDHLGMSAPAWRGVQQVSGTVPRGLGDLRGKVVVLDFWATWCGPCRMIAPKLSALHQRFAAQGLAVIGITTEEREEVALFAQRTAMRYGVAIDANAETTQAYTVSSFPTLFVIDKRGVVRDLSVGYDPSRDGAIENLVKTLLAEPAPSD